VQHRYNWFAWDHLLRARLRPQNGRRFLEVGCAGGKWLIYFHKTFGYSVTGCDYSETGCAMARRNVEAAGIDGTILQQDLFTLTEEFDVIYSHGLIEHFNDPKGVLEKFVSLLHASPGTLISIVPNLTGLSGLYHRLLKPETFTTHRVITLDELRGWYEEIGLHNIEGGALGSFVPFMFPRDKIRREHPQLYRLFWGACLGPLTWASGSRAHASLRTCMRSGKKEGRRWTMFKPNRIDQTSPWGGQGGCPRPRWACRGPPNVGDEAWAGENCWR
jgi:SAM-dependent methyltransferase